MLRAASSNLIGRYLRDRLLQRSKHSVAAMSSSSSEEVLAEVQGGLGIVTLNRPRALNSLNSNMVEILGRVYKDWSSASSPARAVLLQGAGGKAFCAGGDVKDVVLKGMQGHYEHGMQFFHTEYITDHCIATFPRPHIAVLDGITMGGGAGVSMHGHFRVATERTLFAMPECGIGLFPDVGASHFLQRLPGSMGLYLALTGARIKGVALKEVGLATHFISSHLVPELPARLQALGPQLQDLSQVNRVLCQMESEAPAPEPSGLLQHLPLLNKCLQGKASMADVLAALRQEAQAGSQICAEALEALSKSSPLSQVVTLELMRRSAHLSLAECLRLDYLLAAHFCSGRGDFFEGVRCVLIDRGHSPTWKYASVEQVPSELVQSFFRHIRPGEELDLYGAAAQTQAKL